MSRDWESIFRRWSGPPGRTEEERCENAIRAIRNAVAKSPKLTKRKILVFVQGSYRNRVNVREDSDVDVGVMLYDYFLSHYPEGMKNSDFGNHTVDYGFKQFKDELEEALVDHFGRSAVHRGNKAFDIKENTYRVEADLAPFFEYRHYWKDKSFRCSVALIPDRGGRIENYPERLLNSWPNIPQHYENGVAKNSDTGKSFKGVVRILKKLRNEMEEKGHAVAESVPGFLIECMTWNVPNSRFPRTSWDDKVQSVLGYLWSNTKTDELCKGWTEVNSFKYLFHVTQPWTRSQAHSFINALWDYVGVRT